MIRATKFVALICFFYFIFGICVAQSKDCILLSILLLFWIDIRKKRIIPTLYTTNRLYLQLV